ncbi:class I SAM-dependent methyltransferase [Nonomuraea sp. LPB2021202275-12-8]|uniref:class I SAM-dependent methyltransferase n=1 Tax=Nonomuraea sp. LPB2021202275-12-8 TaxID=3120159 RepID=UPI00300D0D50
MLDYDREAACYDETRGGGARADAAVEAIERLLPPGGRVVVDVACGTGIVTGRLRRPGRHVAGVDRAAGMAGVAAARLPGGVVLGDAARLPVQDGSVDAVTMIWLLHLLDPAACAAVLAEAARVLRPGGVLITTVDKNDAAYHTGGDTSDLLRPVRDRHAPAQSDALGRVLEVCSGLGVAMAGRTTFAGLGQGRSPRMWCELIHESWWAPRVDPATLAELGRRLGELPDQDRPRADPVYTLVALVKQGTSGHGTG